MNVIATSTAPALAPRPALQVPWPALLGALSVHDAVALEALARPRQCQEGELIFHRGDAATEMVALVEGQAACGWWQADRGLSAERVQHAPAWLDLAGPWSGARHGFAALAQTPVQLIGLPLAPLRTLVAGHPMLALRFTDALAKEVGRLEGRLHALMHQDAGARLAAWICAQFSGRNPPLVLRLAERKRDIASQLGMTPETLSRLMRSLSDRGVISVSGYQLRVLDPQALQGLANA